MSGGASLITAALLTTIVAEDIYVSSSTGSDAAAGTDPAHPWRTLGRVSNLTLAPGDTVHLFPGDVFDEPLALLAAGWTCPDHSMLGLFEGVRVNATHAFVNGWVVDPALPIPPVGVQISVDGVPCVEVVANVPRPDLVKAGVAPDPDHGLVASLPPSVVAGLQHGAHLITVRANVSGCGAYAWTLPPNGPALPCVCDGAPCRCPSDMGNILPLRVIGTETNDTAVGKRATIRLGGSGVAVTVRGYEHVEVAGIEVLHADHGVLASGQHGIGPLVVRDMVFRGVWNRSSIGQSRQHNGRDCANGWTASVYAGGFGSATVDRSVFDDVDVAFQPLGALAAARFAGNTVSRANGNTILMVGKTDWDISGNIFSRDFAQRFFMCGTTDIMVGGLGTRGTISRNEIGWRGEMPGSPDGCGIDYEGGSDGVAVVDNFIHDSFGAGVMVFGLSDSSRNISNATISRNVFVRNGAQQTSDDRGEIAFMEHGSTGACTDNVFFASDPEPGFVFHEARNGTLDFGWTLSNNTIHPISRLADSMADTPQINKVVYDDGTGTGLVTIVSRRNPGRATTVLYSLDGSWPRDGAPATTAVAMGVHGAVVIKVPRTTAVNVRFAVPGLLLSMTVTLVVPVPFAADLA